MKKLENKKGAFGQIEAYSFREFCITAVNYFNSNPRKPGIDAKEMRERIKLLDILAEPADVIEFEDAEAKKLVELVEAVEWVVVDRFLLSFLDEIDLLSKQKSEKKA